MKSMHVVAVLAVCLSATSAFAGEKTLQEWLRETDLALAALNGKDASSEAARADAGSALSAAAREGEAAALAQYRAGISRACSEAVEMASWFDREGYLSDREGFEKVMQAVDVAVKYVKKTHDPKSTLAADRVMKNVDMAAFVLSAAIEWLRNHRAGRDEARLVRNDIERRLIPYFKAHKIPESARSEYESGMEALKAGKKAFAYGDFDVAIRSFTLSRGYLSSARSRVIVLDDVPSPVN